MKKFLLSFVCMMMGIVYIHAEKACFHGSTTPPGFNAADYDLTSQWVTNSTAGKYSAAIPGIISLELSNGTFMEDEIRWYSGKTITITPEEGVTITKVTFPDSKSASAENVKVTQGSGTISSVKNGSPRIYTWEGSMTTPLVMSSTSQIRLTHLEIEYAAPKGAVENVEINYTLDKAEAIVTLNCATEGATIYYGFNEDAIDKVYSSPIRVTKNCTVYAFAKKGDDTSKIRTLPIELPYTSFKDVIANAKNKETVTIVGDFEIIYNADKNYILTDGTSNILIYDSSLSLKKEVGTKISEISASVTLYNTSLFELTDATLTEGGEGAYFNPIEITTLSEINYDNNAFDQIILKGCEITGKSGKNATIKLGDETIPLYNNFGIEFENGENYDITAFVWSNKNETQLSPAIISGGVFKETVKTPVITPSKRELLEDDKVSITCATAGATIYYTLDGSEPTDASNVYSTPFNITENCTVKARAYNDAADMFPSEIAERTYHLFDPTCNVLTADNHDNNGTTSYIPAHTCTVDGVDYQMVGIHDSAKGIQMNNSANRLCYVIQTGENEGYVVKSIEVDFNDNSKEISFIIRGANTPFGDNEALNNIKTNGVEIGTLTSDKPSVEFPKDYKYFAFYPAKNGVVYMNSITINYRESAPIAKAPELSDALADDFESDDASLLIPALPKHEDWTPMYQINDGDIYEADEEGTFHDEPLAAASHHVIKIWYEHYNCVDKSEVKEYHHVTAPQYTVSNNKEAADGERITSIDFGTIGEGVTVYFTLNGTEPTVTKASKPRKVATRAAAKDGVYNIDTADDLNAVHTITSSTPVINIQPISFSETNMPKIKLAAKAVHTDSGVSSKLVTSSETIDLPTGVAEIEIAEGVAEYYSLDGQRVEADKLTPGVYVRIKDGKTSKVMVK